MTNFDGKFFIGENSLFATREISKALYEDFRKDVESQLHYKFDRYHPWMSCPQAFDYFKEKYPLLEFKNKKHILDHQSLLVLSDAFYLNEEYPFGKVHEIKPNFKINTDFEEINLFKKHITSALEYFNSKTHVSKRIEDLVFEFIPLKQHTNKIRPDGVGRSIHWYIGGIFLGLPLKKDFLVEELAINLAHEVGHQNFMIYQYADRIINSDYNELVYSPIRKVPRPAILSMHAVVALAFMCEFLFSVLDNGQLMLPQKKYFLNRLRESIFDFHLGISSISKLDYTEFGQELFEELSLFSEHAGKQYDTVS